LLGLSTIDLTLPPLLALSFSCATEDDDDEQLLAELGDFR